MRALSSLTNRIFLACTVVAVLSVGLAFAFVNARASREAEDELRRGLAEAGRLVDEHRATLSDTFTRLARLIADLPKLKAAVETGHPPTVQPLAEAYAEQLKADALVLTSPRALVLAAVGDGVDELSRAIERVDALEEVSTFRPHGRGLLQVVSVPIVLEGPLLPAVLGRLTAGFFLDDALAAQFKGLTASEIAFGAEGRIVASTLPLERRAAARAALGAADITPLTIGNEDFLVLARPLIAPADDAGGDGAPVALILRSRTERLRFLNTIRTGLMAALAVTVLAATLLSYGVARTMTRPLDAVTSAMREMAATGDLTRKVPVTSGAWVDEDARLLASTFNSMTESIDRFQKEAGQKERLSALGRLSTVIAHEIRNPLMIIKASLPTLRRDSATPSERREAVSDIDDETGRLNRIVTEVLDFARPIRFELADADVNDICRASAEAAWTGASSREVTLDLDESLPHIHTDAERLRTALVNLLTNARHAVEPVAVAATGTDGAGGSFRLKPEATKKGMLQPEATNPGRLQPEATNTSRVQPDSGGFRLQPEETAVTLTTRRSGEQLTISIQDRGIGIAPEDMPHIFDPYFTTRRAGTGLGLPISRNIIEGLGGSVAVASRRGAGTEIRITLPLARTEPRA